MDEGQYNLFGPNLFAQFCHLRGKPPFHAQTLPSIAHPYGKQLNNISNIKINSIAYDNVFYMKYGNTLFMDEYKTIQCPQQQN